MSSAGSATPVSAGERLLPPHAKPGQCNTRAWQPPQHETTNTCRLVSEASERIEVIPAYYTQVDQKQLISDGKMQWREIMCETNTTPQRAAAIQTALIKAGFDPGLIEGHIGACAMTALNAFQHSKKLPVDKYLNVQTVTALGVDHK